MRKLNTEELQKVYGGGHCDSSCLGQFVDAAFEIEAHRKTR